MMREQMVIKLDPKDKALWAEIAQQLHCKDTTEFARKLTVIMRTTPVNELREWFYMRLGRADLGQPDLPINRIFNTVLLYAIKEGASEIYVEPRHNGNPLTVTLNNEPHLQPYNVIVDVVVLYRVGDELAEQIRVPGYILEPIISHIKAWANLRQTEHSQVQEGTITYRVDESALPYDAPDDIKELVRAGKLPPLWNLNVMIVPSEFGEKVVIRLKEAAA